MRFDCRPLAICAAAVFPLSAAMAGSGFSADVEVGARYDSNVAVLDVDRTSGEGDYAALFGAGIGYDQPLGERASVKIGYNFSQSLHADFDDFDLQTHRGSLDARYDTGIADVGVMFQHVHARLGGDKFMVLQQLSPYVTRMFGDSHYVRLAYEYTDKEFTGRPSRDADVHALSGMLFWFLDGVDRYWLFRYRYRTEDAVDPVLDYDSHEGSVQYSHRIRFGGRPLTGKLRVGYEVRNHDVVDPAIDARRDDRRLRFDSSLATPLGERATAQVAYKYGNFDSNLPAVDFTEHVVELTFSARF